MDSSAVLPRRPRTAHDSASRSSSFADPSSQPADSSPSQPPRLSNRESGEVISNLIFSLSPISTQSEQLLDSLLPQQDAPVQPPGSRGKRRAHTSYSSRSRAGSASNNNNNNNNDHASLLSAHIREEIVVTDKHRDRGELPTVDEGTASSNASPTAVSKRQKLKSLPPPIAVPRRSMSLHATNQAPSIRETDYDMDLAEPQDSDMFGSVSVMPGKGDSPSLGSGEASSGRRQKSPSRAKSTKDRIKELDAERKKRLSSKNSPRSPNFAGKANKTYTHSPSLSRGSSNIASKGVPGLPRTSNLSDERSSSHLKISNPPSRSASGLGHVDVSDFVEANQNGFPAAAAAAAAGKTKRTNKLPGIGGGVFVPPRASSKQSFDVPDDPRPDFPELSALRGPSRPSRKREDISRVAVERDEASTTQRIQELKAQKELRERRDAVLLKALDDPRRSALSEVSPNGVKTQGGNSARVRRRGDSNADNADNDDNPFEQENIFGKRAYSEDQQQPVQKKLVSAASESGDTEHQLQALSNLGYLSRPSAEVVESFSIADDIDDDVDEYLSDPRLSSKIYHQDTGRCVSYSDVGDPNGFVIICCVGMGTTRFVTAFYDELAQTLGLRLITPERPGIGESEPYVAGEVDTPLGWPDDIRLICQHLNISRFALLAHSAGAIYALATALRMPGNIRGRVHILAPWIPPSQLMAIGQNEEPVPIAELPLIQRILKSIPDAWLEAATRVFNMSSITSSLGKSPYARRRRNTMPGGERRPGRGETPAPPRGDDEEEAIHSAPTSLIAGEEEEKKQRRTSAVRRSASAAQVRHSEAPSSRPTFDLDLNILTEEERAAEYDRRLTAMIWQLATSNANPAVDLMVCLERKQEIGFRYEDITKPVVLHHGTKDTRVSVENVVWLGENMRRCEVRILEDEGHGLMANARVMYKVLTEMAQDWRDWNTITKGRKAEF